MRIIRGLHNLGCFSGELAAGCVATLGAFDGLHLGHRAVLGQLMQESQRRQLPSVVVIFEPLPREYFAPLQAPARLMSLREKAEGLDQLGVDFLLVVRFNARLRNMEAAAFIESVFIAGLNVAHLILGDDTHFGRGGKGDIELLRSYGQAHNFDVVSTSTCAVDGARVSSSLIREMLEAGEFDRAEKLLGGPYTISGKVIYGKQLGRSLGAPTANIALHRLRAAMAGVYAVEVRTRLKGGARGSGQTERWQRGVANVGTRPTVDEGIEAILEVHLLDFKADLYGSRLDVRFRHRIRDEVRFESLQLLQQQIAQDFIAARAWFDTNGIV
ncbi:MAG: bifunctional riboflavin kinase/FAD synthetase [Pseudomonadales bacterium]